ncbi:adenylate cyclase [Roseibium aquae]|uniref:Adenylate cyclase n=1 Tax=Roseibium aquae TaxID=1323746 RepID=A0A916X158_9HYPH|nr:adenylate/guanylate cyclase domain-containing protein [Roseibium aquae]GGB53448.1 adenylate cyclase [Roseibium aquae]
MTPLALDPAPRSYPSFVILTRRSNRGASCVPENQSLEDVKQWLVREATGIADVLLLFEEYMWRCRAAGIPVDRSTLHVGTLHPRMIGFSWSWNTDDGLCDELAATMEARGSAAYTRNPLFRVIAEGEVIEVQLTTEEGAASSPLMEELAQNGYTEYVAMPLSAAGDRQNAITFATKEPGGFSAEIKAKAGPLLDVFALHVERHIFQRIAQNVVETYLGPSAGARVLRGEIRRGDGEAIKAVVFLSDLRDFTGLTDRLSGPEVSAVLNTYFETVANAVLSRGGDVLKFIGDGILAVFPHDVLGRSAAATCAFEAAREALKVLETLNREPPDAIARIDGWRPLRAGIALHEGEVFFGNVGAQTRLDFTVIGRAVNETSRVEALCKELQRALLLTEPVYSALESETRADVMLIGAHKLRGVEKPIQIYAPAECGRSRTP